MVFLLPLTGNNHYKKARIWPAKPPQMDLSSLEGPPIHDPRFTILPCLPNVPRIHLEHRVSSQTRAERTVHRVLPTRPASAEIPFQYGRFHHQDRLTPRRPSSNRRSHSTNTPRSTRYIGLNDGYPRGYYFHPPIQNRRFPHGYSSSLDIPPNPHLPPQPHPQREAGQLIWLESEGMWVATGDPSPFSSDPRNSYPYPYPYPRSQPPSPTPALPSIQPQPWMDESLDDDLPPSYESHYFDRVVPVWSREEPEPEPQMPVMGGPAIGTATTQPDTRRWTAVARRVNRASYGEE